MQGHDTFMTVMTNRLIHQGAALTFWRQSPNALVSYLVRTNDDAVTVDILPVIIERYDQNSNRDLLLDSFMNNKQHIFINKLNKKHL